MATQNQLSNILIVRNNLVSTRQLHAAMKIGTKYTTWVSKRRSKGLFGPDSTISRIENTENTGINGQPLVDYMIPLDNAISLAAYERNERGNAIREYLIAQAKNAIKKAKKPKSILDSKSVFSSFSVQTQLALLEEAKPMLDYLHRTTPPADCITVAEFAKLHGTGEQRMFSFLRRNKILFSTEKKKNQVYQQFIDRNIMAVVQTVYYADGKPRVYFQPVITGKGQIFLSDLWEKAQQRKLQIYV